MCKSCSSTQIMQDIALISRKIYTAGTNFTRLPVMTVAPNLNSDEDDYVQPLTIFVGKCTMLICSEIISSQILRLFWRESTAFLLMFVNLCIREALKRNGYLLGIFPKPVPPPPLGTFRNMNVTFGQKKVGFSRQKKMATKISQKVKDSRTPPPFMTKS